VIEEWKAWAQDHVRLFGLKALPGAAETLMEWADLFARLGYSAAEMREASEFVALDPPRYYAEQLGALQERVRGQRARDVEARRVGADRGTCELCGNTGRVVVPGEGLPTKIEGLCLPPLSTTAVLCRCYVGLAFAQRNKAGQLTLAVYERHYPGWRAGMVEISDLQMQRVRANEAAGDLDGRQRTAFDDVLDRVKARRARGAAR
jgi:hypothetical protein